MNDDYGILGLEQGASAAEIKKAYFKMVRRHSPESDPEQFQKIRRAYENLKNVGDRQDAPVFPQPDDPWAVRMLQQIQTYRREKNLALFRDTCEEAWGHFPEHIQFLYELVTAQRKCGNTGKAVKNAELLVKKEPDNKWFVKELAFSYRDRGFKQKAYAACEKAYGLGCRDIDFIMMYAKACSDHYDYGMGVKLLLEIVQRDTRWSRDDAKSLLGAYSGLLMLDYRSDGKSHLLEILESLRHFLEKYSIYLKGDIPEFSLLLANACPHVKYNSEEYRLIDQIFSDMLQACKADTEQRIIHDSIGLYHLQRVAADSRIKQTMYDYLELFHKFDEENDPAYLRFASLDMQLCMMEQREDILRQAAIIKAEHPYEYEKIADFIQKLENEKKLAFLKDSLLKNYRRMEPNYMGGQYFELYPQEKARAMGILLNEGAEDEPYVRSTKKIGRNDPCPCGSGKKYKHCCMNK